MYFTSFLSIYSLTIEYTFSPLLCWLSCLLSLWVGEEVVQPPSNTFAKRGVDLLRTELVSRLQWKGWRPAGRLRPMTTSLAVKRREDSLQPLGSSFATYPLRGW